jgi:NAD(P)-dependent dehydrogenase (short-subunit alcohol dehydrogenase family)
MAASPGPALPPVSSLLDLTGRTALVTGAAQGFGFAIARRLSEAGARVVVTDVNADKAADAAARLATEFGGSTDSARLDISDEAEVQAVFARFGDVDFLVNNAGVFSNFTIENLTAEEFDRIQRVNVRGVFLCSKEFARTMGDRTAGKVIVNIASVDALGPSCPGQVHYTSSKHAVAGLTKGFSVELAPKGVRVCSICPGAALTEGAIALITGGTPAGIDIAAQWDGIAARTPSRRLVTVDDVALGVLFLVSPMAAGITGTLIPVDGGITSQPWEGYVE